MSLCWALCGTIQHKAVSNSLTNDSLSHNLDTEYFEQIVSAIISGDRLGAYHRVIMRMLKDFSCLEKIWSFFLLESWGKKEGGDVKCDRLVLYFILLPFSY